MAVKLVAVYMLASIPVCMDGVGDNRLCKKDTVAQIPEHLVERLVGAKLATLEIPKGSKPAKSATNPHEVGTKEYYEAQSTEQMNEFLDGLGEEPINDIKADLVEQCVEAYATMNDEDDDEK